MLLFASIDYSIGKVVNREILAAKDFNTGTKAPQIKEAGLPPVSSFEVIAFFDGSSQECSLLCGVGGSIKVETSLRYDLKMGGGSGSNSTG